MTKMVNVCFILVLLGACKDHLSTVPVLPNDTEMVLQLALRTAFLQKELPEISLLYQGNLFNDSILVVTDSFPFRLMPMTLDTMKFKFGSYRQITELLKKVDDSLKPNYLYVCCFEKADSLYSVSIQSRSFVPFGGGGSTYIGVIKLGDSMVVKHYLSNSIN